VDSWLAGFIGSMNLIPGTVAAVDGDVAQIMTESGRFAGAPTVPDLAPGQSAQLALRPERLRLSSGDGASRTDFTVTGVIEAFSFLGDQIDYTVRTASMGAVKVRIPLVDTAHDVNLQHGAAVTLGWNTRDARIVPTWNPTLSA
jgi:ABC-type Fe3+/spermidine/putrescine transport system ATPase subunit